MCIEIHGVGRMVRDSSQILRHNAPTSEDDREKPGTQGDKQAVHDASQPFNTQPQRKRGRRLRKRTILTQFGIGLFTIGTPLLFICKSNLSSFSTKLIVLCSVGNLGR